MPPDDPPCEGELSWRTQGCRKALHMTGHVGTQGNRKAIRVAKEYPGRFSWTAQQTRIRRRFQRELWVS